jgi:hypothetical protein
MHVYPDDDDDPSNTTALTDARYGPSTRIFWSLSLTYACVMFNLCCMLWKGCYLSLTHCHAGMAQNGSQNPITLQGCKRFQLLKVSSGQEWGDKETLPFTYNTFIKQVITYGAVIWYPKTDPDSASIKQLQLLQNAGMRLITGAYQMAS